MSEITLKYRPLGRLLVAIIIAVTGTIITIASGQWWFCLLLESGLRGPDVPGRVVTMANR